MTDSLYVKHLDWVKKWFYCPGDVNTPSNDRMHVFVAAVELLGIASGHTLNVDDERNVHDYFTYLLLGWNPITAWQKTSEFKRAAEAADDLRWKACTETMRDLLDFTKEVKTVYPLLNCLVNSCNTYGSEGTGLFDGERITMMTLAVALARRGPRLTRITNDKTAIRACLDLYWQHKRTDSTTVDQEYASIVSGLRYRTWIVEQIDRYFKLNVPTDEMVDTLAYMFWFLSLIRANRMIKLKSRCELWKNELEAMLDTEASQLQENLAKLPMRCDPDKIRDGSNVTRSSWLYRIFRIRPLKVKIRMPKPTSTQKEP